VARLVALVRGIAVLAVIGARFGSSAESKTAWQTAVVNSEETTEAKIERVISAGPPEVARSAKIIDKDAMGL
jgi:hypothetical protein